MLTAAACSADRSPDAYELFEIATAVGARDVRIAEALHAQEANRRRGRLFVRVPDRADGGVGVGVARARAESVRLTPRGTNSAIAERVDGCSVYRGAYGPGSDLLVTTANDAAEIFVLLREPLTTVTLTWDVEFGDGIVGARADGDGGLGFEDAEGRSRLHIPAPYAIDAAGSKREARLAWIANERTLHVSLDAKGLVFPVLLDPAIERTVWQPSTTLPVAQRRAASMTFDGERNQTVVFGGITGTYSSETWTWDGATWSLRTVASPPAARSNGAMAYDATRKYVLLFGGYGANHLGDTWTWNGSVWTPLAPSAAPEARETAMAYDAARQNIVLFSGYGYTTGPLIFGDTWIWNGTTWQKLSPGTTPPGRWGTAMAYDAARQKVVMFSGSNFTADTWLWDGSNWAKPTPAHSPPPRRQHALAYDSARQRVVLFGGSAQNGDSLNDTWQWDGVDWTEITGPTKPGIRWANAMTYDAARSRVVMVGGTPNDGFVWYYHPRGGDCTSGTQCDTGFCVDGVCCEVASCATCERCNEPANSGVCTAVTNAPDPDTCIGDVVCDLTGACRPSAAQTCVQAGDCASGFCVDGRCCDRACDGQCEACDTLDTPGVCTPVSGSPHGARPPCATVEGEVCQTRACDGAVADQCTRFVGSDVSCRGASCGDGVATLAANCNGRGLCDDAVNVNCTPYRCDGQTCATACSSDEGCAPQFFCDREARTCVPLTGAGGCDGTSLVTPDGSRRDCAPYRCGGGACKTSCSSISDCAPPFECARASHTCVEPLGTVTAVGMGCAVSNRTAAHASEDARSWIGFVAASMAAGRFRRRRRDVD